KGAYRSITSSAFAGSSRARSWYRTRAMSAEPRRGANPTTLRIRTARLSETVTTSPARTGRLDASIRCPFTRTRPDCTSDAALLRVRRIRACHNHLSIRWRSPAEASVKWAYLVRVNDRRPDLI